MSFASQQDPDALFAARDPLPTYILIAIVGGVALLTIFAAFVDLAAGTRQTRLISDGDATKNKATIQLQRTESQKRKRTSSLSTSLKRSKQPSNVSASALGGAPHPPTSLAPHDDIFAEDANHDALYSHSHIPLPENNDDDDNLVNVESGREQQQITSIGRRRRLICISIVRIILAAAIIAAAIPGIELTIRYFSAGALVSLASDDTNEWMQAVMRRSVLHYAAGGLERIFLIDKSTDIGVSKDVLNPSDNSGRNKITWGTLVLVTFVVSVIGTLLAVFGRFVPGKRIISYIIFIQGFFWLLASLAAAYIRPTVLPLDASPLERKWLDYVYADRPQELNESRLLANWYISVDGKVSFNNDKTSRAPEDPFSVLQLPGFRDSFCNQFNSLLPKSAAVVSNDPDKSSNSSQQPSLLDPTPAPAVEQPAQQEENVPEEEEDEEPPESDDTEEIKDERPSQNDDDDDDDEDEDDSDSEPVSISEPIEEEPDTPPSKGNLDEDDRPSTAARFVKKRMNQVEKNDTSEVPNIPPPNSIKVKKLSRSLVSEVIIVYLVGKPIGVDQYRAMAYMALPAIVGAPVAIAHMFSSYVLYPFVAVWFGILLIFCLIATPSVLRPLTAPRTLNQVINICDVRYRILVNDPRTRLIAGLDAAIFAIIVFITVIQGYRWLRIAETSIEKAEEKEIKLVNYEEVYSGSGTLRW